MAMCIARAVGRDAANVVVDVKTIQVLLNVNRAEGDGEAALLVDGLAGARTCRAIARFQARRVPAVAPVGCVRPGDMTFKALAAGLPAALTADTLLGVMIHANPRRVDAFVDPLVRRMTARGIDTARRRAHFLAQVGHESGELRYTEEIASGDGYEGRLDLGNTEAGDGRRFKGRGLIQLTGRANYRAFGNAIGVDLLSGTNPQRVATDPDLAVEAACWFWQARGLNLLADADDAEAVTRRINGGLNGLTDRLRQLERARFFLQA
jgi:putative chitinase